MQKILKQSITTECLNKLIILDFSSLISDLIQSLKKILNNFMFDQVNIFMNIFYIKNI